MNPSSNQSSNFPEINKRITFPKYKRTTIRCLICFKRLRAINNAHAGLHGYDSPHPVEDYKHDFRLDKATSTFTRFRIGTYKVGNTYWVGRNHTQQTKIKIASVRMGTKASLETKKKLSKQKKGNKYALGFKHSSKFKKYISGYNRNWWQERRELCGNVAWGGKSAILPV